MKKLIYIALGLVLAMAASSCDKFLDVNENPNYPKTVDARTLLPTVELRLAEKVGYDINLVGTFWSQYVVQCSNTNQYYTVMTYDLKSSSSWFTSPWSVFYGQNLPAIKEIVTAFEKDPTYSNFVFEAKSLLAYHLYLLHSLYGQVCYSKSYLTDVYGTTEFNPNPAFDSETEIYATIVALLEELRAMDATVVDDAEDTHSSAQFDPIFGGDQDNWRAFVNTLYLKVLMRDFTANKAKIQALLAEDNFLAEDAKFAIYEDSADKSSPFYESDRRQLNTPENIRACNDVIKHMMTATGIDYRILNYYSIYSGSIVGSNYGTTINRNKSSRLVLGPTDPVYFSTADEALFLQAEAYARLSDPVKAAAAYNAAVAAAFDREEVDLDATLLAGMYAFPAAGTAEDQVHQIILQKWISNVKGMPIESWFDINRTGYPERGTDITRYVGVLGAQPVRFMYSYYSKTYNTNSPDPVSMDTKMWWHKQ